MATTLTPLQMAAHVDPSLETLRYSRAGGLDASGAAAPQRAPALQRGRTLSGWSWSSTCGRRACRFGTSIVTPNLTLTGDETIPERLALLHEHRTSVVARIAELQHNLEQRDGKLADYADIFGVTAEEPTP